MRVIKQGQIPAQQIFQVECIHCHSVIEFARGEARLSSDQRDGDALIITCPVCGTTIFKRPER